MITSTPRTDAVSFSSLIPLELMKTSQQLERELAASKAEVERLKEQLESTKHLAVKFWKVLEENGFKMELTK